MNADLALRILPLRVLLAAGETLHGTFCAAATGRVDGNAVPRPDTLNRQRQLHVTPGHEKLRGLVNQQHPDRGRHGRPRFIAVPRHAPVQ
jgi:hypothetical protein